MKIAYFTPLNPVRSGISSYSEELLPYLAKYVDIDLYIDEYVPTNALIRNNFLIQSYKKFREEKSKYDLIVYHMGNHAPYHEFIYKTLLEYPGLVVLHDYIYFHFYSGVTLKRRDFSGFKEIMRYCYGEKGIREAEKIVSGSVDPFRYSMVKKILDSSLGGIVHSDYTRDQILREIPSSTVKRINMGIEFTNSEVAFVDRIRRKHGLPKDHFIIASFGMITQHKRIDVALKAFAGFKKIYPNAKYILVGESLSEYPIKGLIKELEIEKDVVITGYVEEETFQEYLILADLCINLRYPTAGETSASVLRALEAGKPVIISNYAQFGEFPDDCAIKLDLGDHEEELLVEYMKYLVQDEGFRRKIGENARRYVHEHHSLEKSSKEYFGFIEECVRELKTGSNRDSVLEEIKAVLSDLGGDKNRDYILKESDNLIAELGLQGGQTKQGRALSLRENIQGYTYYGRRLKDHYKKCGFKDTIKLLADKLSSQNNSLKIINEKPYNLAYRLKCNEIFEEVCILADGRAVCSCLDSLADCVLGDVHSNRIYDIFNSLAYQRIRDDLMRNKPPGFCRDCCLRSRHFDGDENLVMPQIKALQIEVINACNLRCPECVMSYAKRENADTSIMSYETFKEIIDQLKGPLEVVKFWNYGEPFLHKDCIKMLGYVKDVDPRISVRICTNGTLIDEERQRLLVDLGIDVVNFSIDGTSQENYERYRVGGNLNNVLTNMKGLLEYRKRQGQTKPLILWQYILFEWNDSSEEIKKAKKMAVDIGADTLLWVITHTTGASTRFTPDADSLQELVNREGFENSLTQFMLSTTGNAQKKI
ncbi:MAG: glycosyltransferase [Candidatus Aenigmarchaeota archaeon]|nr:glycosyltransferase [Candidatus Aenigmarchaeota archaeon]